MWVKAFKNLFRRNSQLSQLRRGSALFIPNHKATEFCVIVNPYLESEKWLRDIEITRQVLKERKHKFDINNLKSVWEFVGEIGVNRKHLEKLQSSIHTQLKKDKTGSEEEIAKLKKHYTIIQEDLRQLKQCFWAIEEMAVLQALKLPNMLHARTPKDHNVDIFSNLWNIDSLPVVDHVKLGESLNILKYSGPEHYYLINDAVMFELGAKFHFSKQLRDFGFIQFSNPDFARSVVVEGCGLDPANAESVFTLHNHEEGKLDIYNKLHLVGGASLCAFVAYHTKNIIPRTSLPLKYFTIGRQYNPVSKNKSIGLFDVSQATAVEIFTAVSGFGDALNSELDNIIDIVKKLYSVIDLPLKISYVVADKLYDWESLRVSLQIYSSSLKSFVEVANISVSDDYISKRVQFLYKEDKLYKFPKIISGTLLHVPKLLACSLEINQAIKIPAEFTNSHWL